MACLSVTYTTSPRLYTEAYDSPTLTAEGAYSRDISASTVIPVFGASAAVDTGDLHLGYSVSMMTADSSIYKDYMVGVRREMLSVGKATRGDLHITTRREQLGAAVSRSGLLEVTAAIVCTVPNGGYLDLSKYNIWVVPDYWENVDVYSDRNWIVI